jgi:hypothetical protein
MRDTKQACDWGRGQVAHPNQDYYRACLTFSRMCPGAPGHTLTAGQAWPDCPDQFKRPFNGDWGSVKRGTIFIWQNTGAGHAVFCVGGGLCLSNDFHRHGKIDIAPLAALGPWCGGTPMGMIGWVNGVHFYDFDKKPKPELGKVSLSDVRRAALRDPNAPQAHITAGARADVIQVERALHAKGYLDEAWIDGSYGTKTRRAMIHFENDIHAPTADGIAGAFALPRLGKGRFRVVK